MRSAIYHTGHHALIYNRENLDKRFVTSCAVFAFRRDNKQCRKIASSSQVQEKCSIGQKEDEVLLSSKGINSHVSFTQIQDALVSFLSGSIENQRKVLGEGALGDQRMLIMNRTQEVSYGTL